MTTLFKYTLSMVALCGALASCSDETTSGGNANNNDGKELIALSGNDNGVTRAALTRGGFSAATTVEMRIKAEDISGIVTTDRYAKATATASATTGNDLSSLTYAGGMARYWDDAFGRNSQLTIYAFAIPGKTDATLLPTWSSDGWTAVDASTNPNWYIGTEYTTVTWGVETVQTAATMLEDDLTYSNNISANGKGGRYYYTYNTSNSTWTENKFGDGPLTWTAKAKGETTGKFDKGHLVFKHALAKIEINLKESNGYDTSSAGDFQWTNTATGQNITLTGFNTSGTFDVSDGSWDGLSSSKITQMDEETGTPAAQTTRQLYAYVLPGTNLYNTTTNVVEFEIDNSKYYVTGTQIANAIRKYYENATDATAAYKTFTTIESGKHYVINLSVAKKSIERITAAIVDWETVNSDDADAQNTYAKFTLDDRGSKLTDVSDLKFNLYRAAKDAGDYITANTEANYDWKSGYSTTAATKLYDTNNSLWTTNWYYDNNQTYYHFRAVGDNDGANVGINTDANNGDYFSIGSGSAYKDYIWGAPFNKNTGNTFTYSTTYGFDGASTTTHQLAQAISSTGSQINMLLFHVTSHITVNIKTTTGDNKVTLDGTNTKVEILKFLPDGKVLMGNGLVSASGTRTTKAMNLDAYTVENGTTPAQVTFSYGVVPQSLSDGTTDGTIGLRITTPDGNQYVVSDLSKCTATAITNDNLTNPYTEKDDKGNYKITSWFPGYKYTYNITIKKTGIERITAAVVGWETVTGKDIEIDLEN
ncbi:Fimbrillin-like [Xylanibacter ruminicola]|uniref:Fimbrillin-like n=1 Tax=Xylanibacter ruminicola TaxID=839 RepID=A0A1H3ZUL1_XYLRU|nr:fimbrillin family protein [Xylanibacter ruminicola]SEA27388.1 Fimbrillin-like [Xylanibacter ruminicola]